MKKFDLFSEKNLAIISLFNLLIIITCFNSSDNSFDNETSSYTKYLPHRMISREPQSVITEIDYSFNDSVNFLKPESNIKFCYVLN